MESWLDILRNKKWDSLTEGEKENIIFHYRENGKFQTSVVSRISDILFNWLFILNSGGLLSVVTIFSSSGSKQDLLVLCLSVGVCEMAGLVSVYVAAQLEKYRHEHIVYSHQNRSPIRILLEHRFLR